MQRITRNGREVRFARKGDTVSIQVPRQPGPGDEVRHLSSRFLDRAEPKEAGFPAYRIAVDLEARLTASGGNGTLTLRAAGPVRGAPDFQRDLTVDEAKSRKHFADVLQALLAESGEGLFRPGRVQFTNATGLADDAIFVPPSELKRAKNDFYRGLEEDFGRERAARVREVEADTAGIEAGSARPGLADLECFAHRERLSPRDNAPVPFVSRGQRGIESAGLATVDGFTVGAAAASDAG